MKENVRNEPPHSQGSFDFRSLESQWTPKSSESNCTSQNPLDWRVIYIIEKLLKLRCLKWARMTHLDTLNTSYGQKKGRESNWQFDSWPLKVRNRPDFLTYRWRATYCWKAIDEGYNFASDLISIIGLHTKLRGPKIARVPTLAYLGLPFGNPGTKCHLDVSLVERQRLYYKREGGDFSRVWGVVSFVSPNLPVTRPNTKSAPIMH
jgi:hypothetical protein